ncbi:protein of unknown function [Microbacterium sp. Nx66]|nr:protein of unknown function [Microbacterium sp. Nx66]
MMGRDVATRRVEHARGHNER